jgi:hypothetical protein
MLDAKWRAEGLAGFDLQPVPLIIAAIAGAELLVTMAYGERIYNRTWSTLADGHFDEAHQVFHDGTEAFREAARNLP